MKEEIHPEVHPVIFRDTSNDVEFKTTSTLTSDETKTVDGTEYYVIDIEITSASHPFYTGEQRFVDTEGQVDKFQAKMEKVQEKQKEIKQRKEKKYKKLAQENISDIKQKVEENEDINLKKLLSAEKENKNRKTLVSWLKNKIEEMEESE